MYTKHDYKTKMLVNKHYIEDATIGELHELKYMIEQELIHRIFKQTRE